MKLNTASKSIVANVNLPDRTGNYYGLPTTNAPKHDKSRHADVGTEHLNRSVGKSKSDDDEDEDDKNDKAPSASSMSKKKGQ